MRRLVTISLCLTWWAVANASSYAQSTSASAAEYGREAQQVQLFQPDGVQTAWMKNPVDAKSYASLTSFAEGCAVENPVDCSSPPCESACECEPCLGCNMCPCVYGWVEGLVLWRNNQAADQPLVISQNNGSTLLSTNDLTFGAGGGVRAGFGILTCPPCGWEFGYLGIYDQTATARLTGTDQFQAPGDLGLVGNNFGFADEVNARYVSNINSGEIMHVCCCCCCDCPTRCRSVEWLYGFRYLNLNEEFSLTYTDFSEGTSTYNVRTNNNLYGAQIGTRVRHCYGRWSWEGTGKVGLYGNDVTLSSDPITDFPNFQLRPARHVNDGNVAFLADLNLTCIYQINCTWGIRAGYNLIWLEGVALAPDQLDFSNTPTSGTQVVTDGGVFLHGINVGLEARW